MLLFYSPTDRLQCTFLRLYYQWCIYTDTEAAASGLQKEYRWFYSFFKGGDIRFTDRDNNKIIDENDRYDR